MLDSIGQDELDAFAVANGIPRDLLTYLIYEVLEKRGIISSEMRPSRDGKSLVRHFVAVNDKQGGVI